MKTRTSILTYIITLVIGLLLLIFNREADLFKWIVLAIGILFMVPSVIGCIMLLIPSKCKKDETRSDGEVVETTEECPETGRSMVNNWSLFLTSVAGLVLGILLVSMPKFFAGYMIYTFGVIMIVTAIMQMIFIALMAKPYGVTVGYLIVPILALLAGVLVIILGPEKVSKIVTVLTGCVLVAYSINGFVAAVLQNRKNRRIERLHKDEIDRQVEMARQEESAKRTESEKREDKEENATKE